MYASLKFYHRRHCAGLERRSAQCSKAKRGESRLCRLFRPHKCSAGSTWRRTGRFGVLLGNSDQVQLFFRQCIQPRGVRKLLVARLHLPRASKCGFAEENILFFCGQRPLFGSFEPIKLAVFIPPNYFFFRIFRRFLRGVDDHLILFLPVVTLWKFRLV